MAFRRRKRGKLSVHEMEFISKNAGRMSDEEIGARINKSAEVVRKFRLRTGEVEDVIDEQEMVGLQLRDILRSRQEWKEFKKQFTDEELSWMEGRYVTIMRQFKDDILPTEETQIFMAIKYEILMNRCLRERKIAQENVDEVQSLIDLESRKPEKDAHLIQALNQRLQSWLAQEKTSLRDYNDMQDKYNKLMESLKATREQRIKEIENASESFIGLIRKVLKDKEWRIKEGRTNELFKLAAQKEKERLSQLHQYVDGKVDTPILSHETLVSDDVNDDDLGEEE